jgi:hypothetical protein
MCVLFQFKYFSLALMEYPILCGCAWGDGESFLVFLGNYTFANLTSDGRRSIHCSSSLSAPIVHLRRGEGDWIFIDADGGIGVLNFLTPAELIVSDYSRPPIGLVPPRHAPGTGVSDVDYSGQSWLVEGVEFYRFEKTLVYMAQDRSEQQYFSPLLMWLDSGVQPVTSASVVAAADELVDGHNLVTVMAVAGNSVLAILDLAESAKIVKSIEIGDIEIGVALVAINGNSCYVITHMAVSVFDLDSLELLCRVSTATATVYRPLVRFNPSLSALRKNAQVPPNMAITESLLGASLGETGVARDIHVFDSMSRVSLVATRGNIFCVHINRKKICQYDCQSGEWQDGVVRENMDRATPLGRGVWTDGFRIFVGDGEFGGPAQKLIATLALGDVMLVVDDLGVAEIRIPHAVQAELVDNRIITLPVPMDTCDPGGRGFRSEALGEMRLTDDGVLSEHLIDTCMMSQTTAEATEVTAVFESLSGTFDGLVRFSDTLSVKVSESPIESLLIVEGCSEWYVLVGDRVGHVFCINRSGEVLVEKSIGQRAVKMQLIDKKYLVVYAEDMFWMDCDEIMEPTRCFDHLKQVPVGQPVRHVAAGTGEPTTVVCLLEPGTVCAELAIEQSSSSSCTQYQLEFFPVGEMVGLPVGHTGRYELFIIGAFTGESFEFGLVRAFVNMDAVGAVYCPSAIFTDSILPFSTDQPICVTLWTDEFLVVGTRGTPKGRVIVFERETMGPLSKTFLPSREISALAPVSPQILAVGTSDAVVIVGLDKERELVVMYTIDSMHVHSPVAFLTSTSDQRIIMVAKNGTVSLLHVTKDNELKKVGCPDSLRHITSPCVMMPGTNQFVCSTRDGNFIKYSILSNELVIIEERPIGLHITGGCSSETGRMQFVTSEGGMVEDETWSLVKRSS